MEKLVATIPKSARDIGTGKRQCGFCRIFTIRVEGFCGFVWYGCGFCRIPIAKVTALLPALIGALQAAELEARAAGLLPDQDKDAA